MSIIEDLLQNPERKASYEALEPAAQIASQLIQIRVERGLSQRQLAKLVGTSQSAIARIESFEYESISILNLKKIAKALGMDLKIHLVHTQPESTNTTKQGKAKRTPDPNRYPNTPGNKKRASG